MVVWGFGVLFWVLWGWGFQLMGFEALGVGPLGFLGWGSLHKQKKNPGTKWCRPNRPLLKPVKKQDLERLSSTLNIRLNKMLR